MCSNRGVRNDVFEYYCPEMRRRIRFGVDLIPIGTVQKAKSSRAPPAHLDAMQGMVFAFFRGSSAVARA
jgi:hypothetical protein